MELGMCGSYAHPTVYTISHEKDENGGEVKQRGGRKSVQRDCGKQFLSVPFTFLVKMGFHMFPQTKQTKTFRELRKNYKTEGCVFSLLFQKIKIKKTAAHPSPNLYCATLRPPSGH